MRDAWTSMASAQTPCPPTRGNPEEKEPPVADGLPKALLQVFQMDALEAAAKPLVAGMDV